MINDLISLHSTSRELYIHEEEAVSYWFDFQNEIFLNQRNNKIEKQRLVPFEFAIKVIKCIFNKVSKLAFK